MIPDPEVDEYHQLEVDAPAPITFAVAKGIGPAGLTHRQGHLLAAGGSGDAPRPALPPRGPRGLLEETLALGFGVLAEIPDREILVGTYTQPWHQQVTFHPLPPEEFAGFDEPGYVKIVYTLAAEPLGPGRSRFVTRTRVVTTDPKPSDRHDRRASHARRGFTIHPIVYALLTERPSASPAPWGIPRSGTTSHRRWSSRCAS